MVVKVLVTKMATKMAAKLGTLKNHVGGTKRTKNDKTLKPCVDGYEVIVENGFSKQETLLAFRSA